MTVGNRSEILFPKSSCPRDLTSPRGKKKSFRDNNLSLPRKHFPFQTPFSRFTFSILNQFTFMLSSNRRVHSNSFVPRVIPLLCPETILFRSQTIPNEYSKILWKTKTKTRRSNQIILLKLKLNSHSFLVLKKILWKTRILRSRKHFKFKLRDSSLPFSLFELLEPRTSIGEKQKVRGTNIHAFLYIYISVIWIIHRAAVIPYPLGTYEAERCLIQETRFGSPSGSLVGCITCADLKGGSARRCGAASRLDCTPREVMNPRARGWLREKEGRESGVKEDCSIAAKWLREASTADYSPPNGATSFFRFLAAVAAASERASVRASGRRRENVSFVRLCLVWRTRESGNRADPISSEGDCRAPPVRSSFHKHIYRQLDALQWRFNLANAFRVRSGSPGASPPLSLSLALSPPRLTPIRSNFLLFLCFSARVANFFHRESLVASSKSYFWEWIVVRPDPAAQSRWMRRYTA